MSADSVTVLWSFIGALVVSVAVLVWRDIQTSSAMQLLQATNTGLGSELREMNNRLIDIETDRATEPPPPMRELDDILAAPQSWLSQAARAEQAEGVRI